MVEVDICYLYHHFLLFLRNDGGVVPYNFVIKTPFKFILNPYRQPNGCHFPHSLEKGIAMFVEIKIIINFQRLTAERRGRRSLRFC